MQSPSDGEQPEAPEGENRRRHPRAHVDLEVGLRFATMQQFLSAYAEFRRRFT